MRLLVTGGAGFVGCNFIRYWLKRHPKDKIINLDKLTYAGHLSSTRDFKNDKRYTFVKGDICNPQTVARVVAGVDCVVHFAAESHVDRSIVNAQDFVRTNVLGTQVLLAASLKNKVNRFHHVSTDEVFGALPLKRQRRFRENTPYDPRSPYAASKAASDHLVRAYFHTYGLPITITNASNNFGPYQDPEKMIPRFITNLIDGQKVPVYGDGRYVRDWLYVEDHCRAIDKVLRKGKPGVTYLVGGSTKDIDNLAVVKDLLKNFGLDESMIKLVKDRPGHDRRYSVNWSKIKKELDWQPKYAFGKWLGLTVKWYRESEWWWRPLKEKAEKLYQKTGQT